MQKFEYLPSSFQSEASNRYPGLDLNKVMNNGSNNKSARGTSARGTEIFPGNEDTPSFAEKDKPKRTKHLSHLPPAKASASATHSSRTKDRSRTHSLSSTPPATLMKLLHAQEFVTKETKALLNDALTQLDAASARAAKAEAQMRSRETSAILSHTKLTENVVKAEEVAARARREVEAYKLQLRLREEEVKKERERVKAEERMRAEAEKEAERARSLARKWRKEGRVMQAKEDGRRIGYGEGLKRGRLIITAAISAREAYGDHGLIGDGAAYIEEYGDDSDTQHRRRERDHARSHTTRSRRSEPVSRHTSSAVPPSRQQPVNSVSARPQESEPVRRSAPSFPVPENHHPSPPLEPIQQPFPEPEPQTQAVVLRRPPSIQTDPSPSPIERPRSRTPSTISPTRSRVSSSEQQTPSPLRIYDQPSPSPPPVIVQPEETPTAERQSIKAESFSPQIPPDYTPIPIPPPISQIPFAPGLVPPQDLPEPVQSQPMGYFPMPAPPITIVLTPAEGERDVQTPSTATNENSLTGFDLLRGLPAPASRAGSAASGSSSGRFAGDAGFRPDLSTIHEHSREGTAFSGEEELRPIGTLSPERSRSVDQWRRSLDEGDSDLLRPPSSNSNLRHRSQALNLDPRRLSSGSTSSPSINIDIEPPSQSTSPTPQDRHTPGYTDNIENPQDDTFLSPHHAPLTLGADPNERPVIPNISEEDFEDDYDDDQRNLPEFAMHSVPIVHTLPPGFMPTPNGTRIMQLRPDGAEVFAGAGPVAGASSGGVPIGFYGNNMTPRQQNYRKPYDDGDYSRSSSSRSSSTSGSGSSSGTEYARPGKYARNGRTHGQGLTSTFPPQQFDPPYSVDERTNGANGGATLGGIYAIPTKGGSASQYGVPPSSYSTTSYSSPRPAMSFPEPSVHRYSQEPQPRRQRSLRRATASISSLAPQNPPQDYHQMPDGSRPYTTGTPGFNQFGTPRTGSSRELVGAPAVEMPVVTIPTFEQPPTTTAGRSRITVPAVPMPQATVPQIGASSLSGGRSRITAPVMSMPAPSAGRTRSSGSSRPTTIYVPSPSWNDNNPNVPLPFETPAGGSRVTVPAMEMPQAPVRTSFDTRAGWGSRVTAPAMEMPQAPVRTSFDTSVEGASRLTAPAMEMPQAPVRTSFDTPAGGASRLTAPAMEMPQAPARTSFDTPAGGASRLTAPAMEMPQAPVRTSFDTPAGGASRLTAPAMEMPQAPVRSSRSFDTPAGGASRLTAPAMEMPQAPVRTSLDTPAGGSRITAPAMEMPHAPVRSSFDTPAGGGSRITAPAIEMPQAPVLNSLDTPAGGSRITVPAMEMPQAAVSASSKTKTSAKRSRMTAPAVSMPEPTVPSTLETPAGGSRITAPVISMPEATVPTALETPAGGSRITAPAIDMPEVTIPGTFETPAGGSRITVPAMTMPTPNVGGTPAMNMPSPSLNVTASATETPAGGSRITAPVIDMPVPNVEDSAAESKLTKTQKKRMKKKGVSFPEPEVPTVEAPAGSSRMVQPTVSMPTPSVAPVSLSNGTPLVTSAILPSNATMPIPTVGGAPLLTSENATTTVTMPVPTVGGTPLRSGGVLPPSSPAMSSGWGLPGAWGSGGAGTGTPNSRRVSLHAGMTPVRNTEPLPVLPGPSAAAVLQKGRISGDSSIHSDSPADSITRKNTELNKKAGRKGKSAWGLR